MKSHRLARVSEVIREVAASTILFEVRDPRIKNITVTRVETSADLQHAKVYVSVMGSEKESKLALNGLQNAAGFVQSRLAKRLTTRFIPQILFILDDGIKKSIEIARILHAENARNAPVDELTGTDTDDTGEDNELDDDDDDDDDKTPLDEPLKSS